MRGLRSRLETGCLASDMLTIWRVRAEPSHSLSPFGTSYFLAMCLSLPICKIRPDRLTSLLDQPGPTTAS